MIGTAIEQHLDRLTGSQKSAVFFMALGADASAKVMQSLSSDEQESVSRAIANTKSVPQELVANVLDEFGRLVVAVESIAQGGVEYARNILEQALGASRANDIVSRIHEQRVDLRLTGLNKAAPDMLHTVLRGEHPQTIALIVAHLDVKQAANIVESMDIEEATDVLYRIARMEKVSPEMLATVEQGLNDKADLSLGADMTLSGGPHAVASVLNQTSQNLEKSVLDSIAEQNADVADQIKKFMFVFEDLRLLDSRSMQRSLRDIDGKELALALKGASDELRDHIISNMTERAGAALQEELEYMGPVRVKDVEEAQGKIIGTVRALEEAGEIIVAGRGDDDDIIQ